MHYFLNDKHRRMVLNGHYSNWPEIKAGVPQGPLFFLVYINDLPEGMTTNAKLLANDTSFFSVVHNFTSSSVLLNNDSLKKSQ